MSGSQLIQRSSRPRPRGRTGNGQRAMTEVQPLAEAIVANFSSGIAVLAGPDLVFELVNPAFQAFAPDRAMMGRPFAEVWPEISDRMVPVAQEVLATGLSRGTTDTYYRFRRSPEAPLETIFLSFNCMPLRDSAGQHDAILVLAEETTEQTDERERAREVVAESEAAFASATAGIVVYDLHGQVLRMNAAAEKMLGHAPKEGSETVDGHKAMKCTGTADGEPGGGETTPTARALRGETVSGEIMALSTRDGKTLSVAAGAAPLLSTDGTVLGAVFAFADISPLQELQAQREEVIRSISHDLRQPLTPVIGHASILQRRLTTLGLDREARAAEAIAKSARSMDAMIQELVDSVRLEAGVFELHREPTDLNYLITDLAGRVGTAEQQEWLRVECPEPLPPLSVDWERIERAITNLIANAFTYSPSRTPVIVRIVRSREEVVISVIDQGTGIAPEEQRQLFHRLYRTGSGKKAGGLGLGLSITRQIVEAHGGRVWLESKPGKGSSFFISLPSGEDVPSPKNTQEAVPLARQRLTDREGGTIDG